MKLVDESGACHLHWWVKVDDLVGDAELKLDGLPDEGQTWSINRVRRCHKCTAAWWHTKMSAYCVVGTYVRMKHILTDLQLWPQGPCLCALLSRVVGWSIMAVAHQGRSPRSSSRVQTLHQLFFHLRTHSSRRSFKGHPTHGPTTSIHTYVCMYVKEANRGSHTNVVVCMWLTLASSASTHCSRLE